MLSICFTHFMICLYRHKIANRNTEYITALAPKFFVSASNINNILKYHPCFEVDEEFNIILEASRNHKSQKIS
ncbi:hypothetical protein XELAEV_18028980mg [Xenopus laevis]|uniref:Uncharacterized protein n=1 Tax=Xenopus laevis TaxID=8355 RepID=A0A974HHP4_XENLA|nr:hypothetical protein XELAEV_18028980mg [Xenopus laevis]